MERADGQPKDVDSVAAAWIRTLEGGGYERTVETRRDLRRLRRPSRTLRTMLRRTRLAKGARVLEAGCGGGNQLVPLALNGYECTGVDCSSTVLGRCQDLVRSVEEHGGSCRPIELVCADFLEFDTPQRFDLVCNFGVVEHFLDDEQRMWFLSRCFDLCAPGGWVVSVVPSGSHPLRQRVRAEGLGGYDVPEVDYTATSMRRELMDAGGCNIAVIPNNLFGYRKFDPGVSRPRKAVNTFVHLGAQALPRLPLAILYRHATSFIGLAQRPRVG